MRKAFTLIELIIYIGISALVLVTLTNLTLNLIGVSVKIDTATDVLYSSRIIIQRFMQEIRMADDVDIASSVFGTNPGKLVLQKSGGGTITFDVYQKTPSVRTIRRQEDAATAVDLTSDRVDVSNFVLNNRTRGTEAKNIQYEFTITASNPANDPLRQKSITIRSASSVRKQ